MHPPTLAALRDTARSIVSNLVGRSEADRAERNVQWAATLNKSKRELEEAKAKRDKVVALRKRWGPEVVPTLASLEQVDPVAWHDVCAYSDDGIYSVVLTRVGHSAGDPPPAAQEPLLVLAVAAHAGVRPTVAHELLRRVQHVAPEVIVEGVSLDNAVAVKDALTRWGATLKIKEGMRRTAGGREAIPERVRREVWRRDGGRCVDCGSRERLEYDHIIPVSKGGANTARNIELRCESCNRTKAAKV